MRKFLWAACLAVLPFAAAAQVTTDWPTKPLTLIVPFGPGSSPDTMARAIAEEASTKLGQPIVVQNKPGASGNLGTAQIAKAKPDGYTFGVSITGPLVNNTVLYSDLPYDPKKDIDPLTLGVHQHNILVVPANSPIKSFDDLLKAMKSQDKPYNFPSTGAGTVSHLAVELLLERTGGKAVHVPYASSPAAVTSLIAGDTDFAALPPIAVMPMIKDGRLRALAAVSKDRLSFLPDTPTIEELGVPGIEGSGWIGFVAPAGIPADVQQKLSSALAGAINAPAVKERLATLFMEPAANSPQEFRQYMDEELNRWEPLIKRLNLTVN
ncbi:Bug family tripartite tricarboxylate transporter substrate binding protein [Bordetella sp. 02P26C-1]|uniref:Bug family tripartite tricarboxylate transporter substrate binding protein n=1 Tax=Bordetella sp. 02P26C-1 TaxID=2683195 RepID=UPI0013547CD1|nr:tripartite tricarboxylate transporter substrate binding protein [Bordetella sp. 02P26C-1]MVW77472.1 tripartite tricarboxylate transporter substrate binding protein [Bordetella sp. 02P26C-1]